MTKQELFKQADYTFQRGNRQLAKKYLSEYLAAFPNDEAAWMLMARIVEEKGEQINCYERVLRLDPGHNEARIGLVRARSAINPTLPRRGDVNPNIWQTKPKSRGKVFRAVLVAAVILFLFGTTSFVIARNNPESKMGQALALATPTLFANADMANDIAPQTRAEIGQKYPQYAPLVDALIVFAVENANKGMDGAPERPGAEIVVSEKAGMEAESVLENALPQPGSLSSVTITEQQVTSWLAMEMQNNPDLPLSDMQVYLRNGKVQIWGMVNGSDNTTSVLITGRIEIDGGNQPHFDIESIQIGQQVIPALLVTQAETWLNQALLEGINSQAPGLQLMNVNVTNGLITVSGMR